MSLIIFVLFQVKFHVFGVNVGNILSTLVIF